MKIKTLSLEKNNKKQFNKELNKGQSIVAIVAPDWCGHCKEMMPDWEEINNEYDGADVLENALIGTITDKNMGLSDCSKDVGGFPTIKIFDNGNERPYGGRMDKDSFDKLVKKTFKFASVGGGKSLHKTDSPEVSNKKLIKRQNKLLERKIHGLERKQLMKEFPDLLKEELGTGKINRIDLSKINKESMKKEGLTGKFSGEAWKKGNYKPGFFEKRKMKRSRRKYLPGLNAGKKKRKTRKRRGSGPEKREGELTHMALSRPRVTRQRRNRTRRTVPVENDGPEKWDGGRKKKRKSNRRKRRKRQKTKRKRKRKKR